MTTPHPTKIDQVDEQTLSIDWSDGHRSVFPVRGLRLECRCAKCLDEVTHRKILDESNVPRDVHPRMISPVGRYAVTFDWSDGHTTGIYTFEHLREICPCPDCQKERA